MEPKFLDLLRSLQQCLVAKKTLPKPPKKGLWINPLQVNLWCTTIVFGQADQTLFVCYSVSGIAPQKIEPIVISLTGQGFVETWKFDNKGTRIQEYSSPIFPPRNFTTCYDEAGQLRVFTLTLNSNGEQLVYAIDKGNGLFPKAILSDWQDADVKRVWNKTDLPIQPTTRHGLVEVGEHHLPLQWKDEKVYERVEQLFASLHEWYAVFVTEIAVGQITRG